MICMLIISTHKFARVGIHAFTKRSYLSRFFFRFQPISFDHLRKEMSWIDVNKNHCLTHILHTCNNNDCLDELIHTLDEGNSVICVCRRCATKALEFQTIVFCRSCKPRNVGSQAEPIEMEFRFSKKINKC